MPLPVLVGSTYTNGTVASPGPTLSYTSTAGNTLILTGSVATLTTAITGITSITDSAGNTWQYSTSNSSSPPSSVENSSGGDYLCTFVAWCVNAAAVTSVTVHDGTGNSDYWQVALSEWQNIAAFDTANAASGTSAGPTAAPVTPAVAGSLLIGAGTSISASSVQRPFGWNVITGSGSNIYAWTISNTVGTQADGWTLGSGAADWTTAVAAFRPVTSTSIAEDPSTPATVTQTADQSGTTTTASFTPPANSILVALYNVVYAAGGSAGLTISDSASGTWNVPPGTSGHNAGIWWRNTGPSPSAMTITVTDSQNGSGHVAGRQLSVRVLTGAAAAIGYAASGAAGGTGTTFFSILGAQAPGSVFYACGAALHTQTLTALPGTTTISDLTDTSDGGELFTGKTTYPSVSQGYPVELGWNGTTGAAYGVLMLEVLPAATPAEGNTIWGQASNITTGVTADTGGYTLGVLFEAMENGTLDGVWFWSGSGSIALPTRVGLWSTNNTSSTLLDAENANWSGPAGSGWIRTALTNPQALTAGTYYGLGVFYAGGSNWYTGTTHWFDTNTAPGYVGIPFGPAYALNATNANTFTYAGGQMAFNSGGTDLIFPRSTFNAGNYWIDPEITIATPGSPYVVQEMRAEGGYSGSFMKNITPGNAVVMMVTGLGSSAPVTSAPLIGGATVPGAVKIGELSGANGTQYVSSALWLLPNLPGGNATASITIANDTPTANSGLLCWEVAGLGNAPVVDVSSTGSGNGTSLSSGTTAGVAGPGEFVVGMLAANSTSYNVPTWYTSQIGIYGCTFAGWQVTSSAGTTYSYTGLQATGDAWSSIIAAIQPRSNGLVLPDQVPAIYQQRIR